MSFFKLLKEKGLVGAITTELTHVPVIGGLLAPSTAGTPSLTQKVMVLVSVGLQATAAVATMPLPWVSVGLWATAAHTFLYNVADLFDNGKMDKSYKA